MPIVARVYLVRHGETDANRNGIIQGQLDTSLNDTGLEQARSVGGALRSIRFDIAYSSDLARASKTAEMILVPYNSNVRLQRQEELRERFLGNLQGTLAQPGSRLAASADSTVESGFAFTYRAMSWWDRMILQRTASMPSKEEPYNILVTTHGGFIGTLVKALVRSSKAKCAEGVVIWKCRNSSITVIELEQGLQGVVVQYGGISHLEGSVAVASKDNVDEVEMLK